MIDILRLPRYIFKPYLILRSGRESYRYRLRDGRVLEVGIYEDPGRKPRYRLADSGLTEWSHPKGLSVSSEERTLVIDRMRKHFGGNMGLVSEEA